MQTACFDFYLGLQTSGAPLGQKLLFGLHHIPLPVSLLVLFILLVLFLLLLLHRLLADSFIHFLPVSCLIVQSVEALVKAVSGVKREFFGGRFYY